ncbi:MAG: T9SS type A sorting domain-containing protein, partial [Ignavibacteriaceae bacterium]|nr:T9SS type A sorting domain-containing protein [Ignavibacteriaceae bacterium]
LKTLQGVTEVEDATVPLDYSLEQNYPNPFNPTTSIRYAVSKKQFISLKIYDVLGNEVATLVNEEKDAGSYKVEFSTNDLRLTSGIYLYTLTAGNFKETKKMVLMK